MKNLKSVIWILKSVIFMLSFVVLIISSCNHKADYEVFTSDPILDVVHGSITGTDGTEIKPSENFILGVQAYYIKTIRKNLNKDDVKTGIQIRRKIDKLVTNKVLANALFLEWMLEKEQRDEKLNMAAANNALRWYYISNIQKDPIHPIKGEPWAKGIETEIANKLEFEGLDIFIEVDEGLKYRKDCLDAGVPIPDKLLGDKWVRLGFLEQHVGDNPTELLIYRSFDPPGFCLAVARFGDSTTVHYALICFGTQSNKACFFEDSEILFNEDSALSDVGNSLSLACTHCHLGKNPFIVWPEDPAFVEAAKLKSEFLDTPNTIPNLMGTAWYTPIFSKAVPDSESFPKNPEPNNIIEDLVFSEKKCTSCHSKVGTAGRFPKMLNERYCRSVIDRSLFYYSPPPMPSFDQANADLYINDINHLRKQCGFGPFGGGETEIEN